MTAWPTSLRGFALKVFHLIRMRMIMLIAVIMIIMNIIIDRMMISSMILNCVSGANIDQSSCECPDGFDEYEPEFRSHGLHKLCRGPGG